MKSKSLPVSLLVLGCLIVFSATSLRAQNVTYILQPDSVPAGIAGIYDVYLSANDNSSLKDVTIKAPRGYGVTIEEPTVLADNDKKRIVTVHVDSTAQPSEVLLQITKGTSTHTVLLNLLKRAPVKSNFTEGGAFAWVTLIDPDNVHDIFGRRISQRYIALQVTIENYNEKLDYLLHDVSLDLNKVFLEKTTITANRSRSRGIADPDQPPTKEEKRRGPGLEVPLSTTRSRRFSSEPVPEAEYEPGAFRYRLSSLELSLLRGTAEKGQGQDRRNFILRTLRGAGSLLAAFLGVTTFGPSYAPAVAMFNGPLLTSYTDVLPDYTINQMNRLNDSAYRANTLVPKGQSKVIVVFIPQATFLTDEQRKVFQSNPLLLAYPANGSIDFRRTEAIVHGSLIEEVENQPPSVTTAVFDSDSAANFQNNNPVVKGRVIGKSLSGADVRLIEPTPPIKGLTITKESASDTALRFVLKADEPISKGRAIGLEIVNDNGTVTTSIPVQYSVSPPTVTDLVPKEMTGSDKDQEISVDIKGTNFSKDMKKTDVILDPPGGVTTTDLVYKDPTLITAKFKVDKNVTGDRRVRVKTPIGGPSLEPQVFTIKKP